MEPLTPNDPLWKVLGRSKPVNPRPNFTQNMVRLARQTQQERGWLAGLKAWWQQPYSTRTGLAWATAAAAVIALTATWVYPPQESTATLATGKNIPLVTAPAADLAAVEVDFPLVPNFETEWKDLEQMGDLLAIHDTALLTDSEINALLY